MLHTVRRYALDHQPWPSQKSGAHIAEHIHHHHHIISGFGIYGAAVVPDTGVGNTWHLLTLVLHEFLSNGLTPSRLHIVLSFLTHADHVFLGLPRSLVPGSSNRVMELMHEVARCTCPYHLRRRLRRTPVISSRSSFWWSTAEEISSSYYCKFITCQLELVTVTINDTVYDSDL